MFSFNRDKLKLENLDKGRFGIIYPYEKGSKNSKWDVEVIKAIVNKELPKIIEQIVIGFSYDDPDAIPVEGFYLEPAAKIYNKVSTWNLYIKRSRQENKRKEDDLHRSKGLRRAWFDFDKAKLIKRNLIGKGGSGRVYPYQEESSNVSWAVKEISAPNAQLPKIIEEIMIGFSCRHANVLPIEGFYMESVGDPYASWWDIYIKMPRMQESLKDKLARHKNSRVKVPIEEVKKIFYQITDGLKYLHERKIAHRDLKPSNILLDDKGDIRIADMGQANFTMDQSQYIVNDRAGIRSYRAPEIEELEGEEEKKIKKKDLFKSDIWSLGLIMAETCFIDMDIKGTAKEKRKTIMEFIELPMHSANISVERITTDEQAIMILKHLLTEPHLNMLSYNQDQRPSVQQLETGLNRQKAHDSSGAPAEIVIHGYKWPRSIPKNADLSSNHRRSHAKDIKDVVGGGMFSFQEQSLDTGTLLYMGPLGPVYSYSQDSDDNRWAVEVITTTNQQLISYIEDIILRFTYLNHIAPMESFYMKPIEEKAGKVNEWEIYIKVPRGNGSPNFGNIQISERATFEFKADRLMHENRIGKGAFGFVYPYQEGLRNDEWVVKVMSVSNSELPRVIDEILIGFSCKHQNILPIEGFHMEPVGGSYEDVEKWNVYIKMPRMKESLKEKLERHRRSGPNMSVEEGKKYIFQIIDGLKYLHDSGIAHRDLKPGNILLDANGNALIADMSQANLIAGESESTANNRAGTKSYRAPELESEKKLMKKDLFKADIWSLGLIIAEICFINTDVKGTDDEKAENLRKRIQPKVLINNGPDYPILELFDFNPEEDYNTKTIQQIETITTDKKIMAKLRDQAIEFNHLEVFFEEAKRAKDYFNACYSRSILIELEDILERCESIFSCNPEERPTIQELHQSLNRLKASDLLEREISKLNLQCIFYKDISLDDDGSDSGKMPLFAKFLGEIREKLDQEKEIDLLSLNERMKAEAKEDNKNLEEIEERTPLITLIKALKQKFYISFSFKADEVEQSLEITAQPCIRMDKKVIRALLQSIHTENAKNLRSLKLEFPRNPKDDAFANIPEIDTPGMYPLNLQKISINLRGQKIGTQGYKRLFEYLGAYHKNITLLHLSFADCDGFRDSAVQEFELLIVSHLKCLKNLDFNFNRCKNLTDNVAIELLQKIGLKGKSLTSLRLDFIYCELLSQATSKELTNQLENFGNLFHLKLEIYSMGEEASRYLFESMRKLENLQILKLGLASREGLRMTDAAVEALATSIGAHLKKLQILSLTFYGEIKITDKSAQQLISQIGSNLTDLRNFTLRFSECEKIGDGTVKELQNQIRTKSLVCTHLDLSFGSCPKVSSQAIQDLVQQITTEDHQYRYLGLRFSQCGQLDDDFCKQIAYLLGEKPATLRLYLDLSGLHIETKTQRDIQRLLKSINVKRIEFGDPLDEF